MGLKKFVTGKMTYRLWFGVWVLAMAGFAGGRVARAATPEIVDANVLQQMEVKAAQADPREKCYRYAEVLAGLTELEGQQLAAGQQEQAQATMRRMNEVSAKVHAAAAGDAKRLKNAEQMLEHATRRVSDMVHVAGEQEQAAMQATLQHMNMVHNELLAMVFAH